MGPATELQVADRPSLLPAPPPGLRIGRWLTEEMRAGPLLRVLESLGDRDPELRQHCVAVGDLAERTALRLGFAGHVGARLRLAGILHDIGKVAIPGALLQKPGPLDADEWERVREHPQTGFLLIRGHGLDEIAEWVLTHHERPDGRGYPFGLRSHEVPLQGAILAAADAFHAMVVERPYQASLTPVEAREELRRCAGSQFEPVVVQALCEVTKVGRFQREPGQLLQFAPRER